MNSLLWKELSTKPSVNNHGAKISSNQGAVNLIDGQLSVKELKTWEKLVKKGLNNALVGLSDLLGHELKLNSLNVEQIPIRKLTDLINSSDAHSIGTRLTIEGDISGQIMLIHSPEIAFRFIDLLLDLPIGTTNKIGNLERCALEDIGNITGSYFLNTLADNAGLIIMPSPPEVVIDRLSAIMNTPIETIRKQQTHTVLVKSTFSADSQKMDGTFIVLPTFDFVRAVTQEKVTLSERSV
ncbi:MAG: hypothetical protein JW915_04495 [Chitinispirillaceae bacterium]|nr:hypothetical protein [Chitinispirillaceae bacterium]